MSVRRLAEPAVQPPSFAFNPANEETAVWWIGKYPEGRQQSAIIPLLMIAQEQDGWVTKAAIEHVADRLKMPYIRALEVATFYTQYQLKPVGTKAHVQVCGTTPCMLRGAEALIQVCRDTIHPEPFHPNASGTLSWEEVECLGACVNAPMVMIFKDTYEDLTPQRLAEIIADFEAGKGEAVKAGPQNGRIYSAPEGGLTSLKDEHAVLKSTRDAEAKAAADRAAQAAADQPNDAGSTAPPSEAARPTTHATETNAAIHSPSPEKVPAEAEKAAGAEAPAHNGKAANAAEPSVEHDEKQRSSKGKAPEQTEFKSPELLKGESLGPDGKRPSGNDRQFEVGANAPDAPKQSGSGAVEAEKAGAEAAKRDPK